MSVLLDTNILLRMSNKLHPMHVASRESVTVLEADGMDLTKTAHDARLVAAMERHRISFILTFNTSDFARYPNIQSLTPNDVVNGARFPAILP